MHNSVVVSEALTTDCRDPCCRHAEVHPLFRKKADVIQEERSGCLSKAACIVLQGGNELTTARQPMHRGENAAVAEAAV